MPEYDPWGLSGPIRNIGGILAQTPRLRAEAEAGRQRGRLTEAQIGTEGAQAEHYRAGTRQMDTETAGLAEVGRAFERLKANAGPAARMLQSGKVDDNLFDAFAGDLAFITGKNKDDIGKAIRELAATGMVSQAGTNITQPQLKSAAALANPSGVGIAEVRNEGLERIADEKRTAEAARPVILPNQSTAIVPKEGRWDEVGRGGFTLGPGQQRFTGGTDTGTNAPVATVAPLPQSHKSSAFEQERARLLAALAKMDAQNATTNAPGAIQQFDRLSAGPSIPEGAIKALRANPELARQFEAKYGPGSASAYLK